MMINNFPQLNSDFITQVQKGAFLIVKSRDNKLNTMTIGWATTGVMWGENVMMVVVRPSRYTFQLIENADDFTVVLPRVNMSKELGYCGTKSGKEVDKFKECKLSVASAKLTKTPIIQIPAIVFECEIVNSSLLDKNTLNKKIDEEFYADHFYHKLYFGKIVACYETL